MTAFEKAVEELMTELNREIGSGLLSRRALELMTPITKWLELIKRLERSGQIPDPSSTRPDGQTPEKGNT